MGWKLWTRERLTSTEFQQHIQDQTVLHFASLAAANSAIPTGNRTDGMVVWLEDVHYAMRWDLAGGAWRWAFGAPLAPAPIAWPAGSGWGVVGGYAAPGLFLDVTGLVHGSSAVVATGAIANAATIATMPVGYRPDALVPLQIPASTVSGDQRVDVATSGVVSAVGAIASGVVLFLDGFTYNPNTMT